MKGLVPLVLCTLHIDKQTTLAAVHQRMYSTPKKMIADANLLAISVAVQ